METLEAIKGRKSIRAFLPRPVPEDIIVQMLEASRWAPSGVNTQRWRVTVATGEKRKELAAKLVERAREREACIPSLQGAPPDVRRRSKALLAGFTEVAEAMGISLWEFVVLGSYGFYGAPVVVIVSHLGKHGGQVPLFVTTMLIAAHDLGLGTCWLGYPLSYSDLIHQILEIPDEERIRAVVAMGYPDPGSPANAYRSPRDGLEAFVRWVGFD